MYLECVSLWEHGCEPCLVLRGAWEAVPSGDAVCPAWPGVTAEVKKGVCDHLCMESFAFHCYRNPDVLVAFGGRLRQALGQRQHIKPSAWKAAGVGNAGHGARAGPPFLFP